MIQGMPYACVIYIDSLLGDPPDIDEGPFLPLPSAVPPGDRTVMINTPAYVEYGYNLTLVCNIASGTHPITIMWLRDGQPYPAGGNNSVITVSDYTNGENITCRAENVVGFDMESTTVNVFGKGFLLSNIDIDKNYIPCNCTILNSLHFILHAHLLRICIFNHNSRDQSEIVHIFEIQHFNPPSKKASQVALTQAKRMLLIIIL